MAPGKEFGVVRTQTIGGTRRAGTGLLRTDNCPTAASGAARRAPVRLGHSSLKNAGISEEAQWG